MVKHGDLLERPEVLHIHERDEAEIKSLLGSEVTFQGNIPDLQLEGDPSSTILDEDSNTSKTNEEPLPGTSGIIFAQAEEGQEIEESCVDINKEEKKVEEKKEQKKEDEVREHTEEEKKREHKDEEGNEHVKHERKRKKKDRRATSKRKKPMVENHPEC